MIVGIIGLGEVGKAIKKLCQKKHKVYAKTRSINELAGKEVDVLHLCFPYSSSFVDTAVSEIEEFKAKLVINDSSVKPGTTQEIYQKTAIPIVHAPIIGKHPGLYKYLFEIKKIIGPASSESYKAAKKHFEELGIKTIRFRSPLESEMAKILSTTYYGWNIIYEKYVYALCQEFGADFNQVYTKLNRLYNQGYKRTLPNVSRPILKHMEGPIGGHCVIPNAQILNDWLGDELTSFLLIQNAKEKKKSKKEK